MSQMRCAWGEWIADRLAMRSAANVSQRIRHHLIEPRPLPKALKTWTLQSQYVDPYFRAVFATSAGTLENGAPQRKRDIHAAAVLARRPARSLSRESISTSSTSPSASCLSAGVSWPPRSWRSRSSSKRCWTPKGRRNLARSPGALSLKCIVFDTSRI